MPFHTKRLLLPLVLFAAIAPGAPRSSSARITVGRNVQVSAGKPAMDFAETTVCADPNDPSRLVVAAMYEYRNWPADQSVDLATTVFASRDSGRTWTPTLDTRATSRSTPDPACAFGPGGVAYYTVMAKERGLGPIALFRSEDGGANWAAPTILDADGGLDRQWIAVDNTDGPNRERVYVSAFRNVPRPPTRDLVLFRSSDAGQTFEKPVVQKSHYLHNGSLVVLSDGTVVGLFAHPTTKNEESPDLPEPAGGWPKKPVISVVRSTDGGATVSDPIVVSELKSQTASRRFLLLDFIPSLAADTRGTVFKDRLYAVWLDVGRGRARVMFAYSADAGKTWSNPVVVSDDQDADPRDPEWGPDSVNPVVAVNPDGVVGVLWYDRRDNKDFGYWPRFTASLDGGETWTASVRVSEKPQIAVLDGANGLAFARPPDRAGRVTHELVLSVHNGFNFKGGDTAGLSADATGVFRAVWVDNRTGRRQVWTAPIAVQGRVAQLRDVSESVVFALTDVRYDRLTRIASMDATLRNASPAAIAGPFDVQALSVRSGIALEVTAIGATNGLSGEGAVWTFAPLNGVMLAPGATITRRLQFRLGEWSRASINPLSVSVRVLAPAVAAGTAAGVAGQP